MSSVLDDYLQQTVVWAKTEQAEFPYLAEINGQSWQIRINDFPEQPLYTLFVGNQEIGSFDQWSHTWQR
jgi:hypothetical protein